MPSDPVSVCGDATGLLLIAVPSLPSSSEGNGPRVEASIGSAAA
jgi:hypothetical protein